MKAKSTERKCKDCEVIIPYIPRKIRCINCHKQFIDEGFLNSSRSNNIPADNDNDYIIL